MLAVFPFVFPEAVHFTFKEKEYMEEIALTRNRGNHLIRKSVPKLLGSKTCPHMNCHSAPCERRSRVLVDAQCCPEESVVSTAHIPTPSRWFLDP